MKVVAFLSAALLSVVVMLASASAQQGQGQQEKLFIVGQITNIAEDGKTIKITEREDGRRNLTMNVLQTTKVRIDGEIAKLSDLKKNDVIECISQRTDTTNVYKCVEIRRNRSDQQ